MTDLTHEQVLALANAAGMTILADDLKDVTLRLNALLEGLKALDELQLDDVLPLPALPHPKTILSGGVLLQ